MDRIYLDANATTPVLPEVVEAMRPFWSETFGNPSSAHHAGQRARSAVDHSPHLHRPTAGLFGKGDCVYLGRHRE